MEDSSSSHRRFAQERRLLRGGLDARLEDGLLAVESFHRLPGLKVGPIALQPPRAHGIRQRGLQYLPANERRQCGIFDGEDQLHAPVKVSSHQIGAAEIDLRLPPVLEIEDAAVLEKSSDDAEDPDRLADSRQSRPEAADSPDDEVDHHAGRRRRIKLLDHPRVCQRVHFEEEPCRSSLLGMRDLPLDQFSQAFA